MAGDMLCDSTCSMQAVEAMQEYFGCLARWLPGRQVGAKHPRPMAISLATLDMNSCLSPMCSLPHSHVTQHPSHGTDHGHSHVISHDSSVTARDQCPSSMIAEQHQLTAP